MMTREKDPAEKYEVREQIGKGAFGAAFLVVNRNDKREYVMKRVRLARQTDWQRKASFQEMELVGALQHPFIVPHIESWVDRGHTINTVYSYCSAGDLGSMLQKAQRKGRRINESQLKSWLCQILLAVDYMHKNNVIHRDIKSGNLFLTEEGHIQVGDFGLATFREGGSDDDQSVVGTPHYMSPELLSKKAYSFKSDIWSIGCVMYELTAQRPAFTAFNLQGLITKIKNAKVLPISTGGYNDNYLGLIKWMLQKKTSNRPTAEELLRSPVLYSTLLSTVNLALSIQPDVAILELPDPEEAEAAASSAAAGAAQSHGAASDDDDDNSGSGSGPDGSSGEGAGEAAIEAAAEQLARQVKVEDLDMDFVQQPPPKLGPARSSSPTVQQQRGSRVRGASNSRSSSPNPMAAGRLSSADSRTRQSASPAASRPRGTGRTGAASPQPRDESPLASRPAWRSPRSSTPTGSGRAMSPGARPMSPDPRAGASPSRAVRTDEGQILRAQAGVPASLSPRMEALAFRLETVESVLALATRLHETGRTGELGYLLSSNAAKNVVAAAPAPEPDAPGSAPFRLGDQVMVGNRRQLLGTIRYYGPTAFAGGDWVGMELDLPEGKNDGTVKGVSYFACAPNSGLFVKASILRAARPRPRADEAPGAEAEQEAEVRLQQGIGNAGVEHWLQHHYEH